VCLVREVELKRAAADFACVRFVAGDFAVLMESPQVIVQAISIPESFKAKKKPFYYL
jgi:hypothetical protein